MKIDEIKNNPEILSKLRFELSPQDVKLSGYQIKSQKDIDELNKRIKDKAGYFFFIDVYKGRANLALMHNTEDGSGNIKMITDFDDELLLWKAVEEAGGGKNKSGWYPINIKLKEALEKLLAQK